MQGSNLAVESSLVNNSIRLVYVPTLHFSDTEVGVGSKCTVEIDKVCRFGVFTRNNITPTQVCCLAEVRLQVFGPGLFDCIESVVVRIFTHNSLNVRLGYFHNHVNPIG